MIAKSKVPQIRFKGFGGEWEEKLLNEISSSIFDGTHQTPTYTETGIPFFSVENLISRSKNKFISNIDHIEATKNNKPERNDVLITRIGNIGFSKVIDWNYSFSIYVTLAVIKQSKYFNSYFLTYNLQSSRYQKEILTNSLLSAVPCKINMNELRKTKVLISLSLNEQTKIGNYFQNLDKLIEQKEKKQQKLKQFKKAMLDKMFPKNGADTPEIRFKGFSGEWVDNKLVEVVDFIGTGKSTFNLSIEKTENKLYPVLGSRTIIGYDSEYDYLGNFILTARVGENAGRLYKYSGKVKITDNTVYIKAQNLDYFFYFLINYDLKKLAFGTGQPLIKSSELSNLKLILPNKTEQTKIGNYFQKLDKLTDLQLQEIEKLKNIKKASLDKMFV